jgi:hypothetical protein
MIALAVFHGSDGILPKPLTPWLMSFDAAMARKQFHAHSKSGIESQSLHALVM